MNRSAVVVLMARRSESGGVAEGLASDLGERRAQRVYDAMARDTWAMLSATGLPLALYTTGGPLSWLPGCDCVYLQPDAPYGERMDHLWSLLHADEWKHALVAGPSAPHLAPWLLAEAYAALCAKGREVVAQPTDAGGLALLGVRVPGPFPMGGLPWGTSRLGESLRSLCLLGGVDYHEIGGSAYALERASDLGRLLREPPEVLAGCALTARAAIQALAVGSEPLALPQAICRTARA